MEVVNCPKASLFTCGTQVYLRFVRVVLVLKVGEQFACSHFALNFAAFFIHFGVHGILSCASLRGQPSAWPSVPAVWGHLGEGPSGAPSQQVNDTMLVPSAQCAVKGSH